MQDRINGQMETRVDAVLNLNGVVRPISFINQLSQKIKVNAMNIEKLISAVVLVLMLAIPGFAQEREIVQEMEKLERSLVELTQRRDQLSQKLEVAADKNQEGNVKELKAAIKGNAARMNDAKKGLGELRAAMRQRAERAERAERGEQRERAVQGRERSERGVRERAEQNRERAEQGRERGEQNRERGERERTERGGAERELNPDIRAAMNKLNHLKQAMGHLREAGMNDLAEVVEKQMNELGGKIEQSIARARNDREGNQRDRTREGNRETEREVRQDREAAASAARRRSDQRESVQRESAQRLDGVVKEFGAALREMRNEIRELRSQMEQMKKERDR
jgi:hypothetical protein